MTKSKKSTILKWTILATLLCYCTGMTIWAHGEARRHVCTGISVEVEGNPAMEEKVRAGVIEELRSYPRRLVGAQLHQINTGDVERYLDGLDNFESVNCMLTGRGELVVSVTPLIPVMRVFFGENSYYINKDGKHIESNAEFHSDVPVVTGRFNRSFAPRDILPLADFISRDHFMKELVGMIEAHDPHNLLIVPRIRGHVVNFGDTTRLDEKKRALALFYREVMPYKGWEEYDTISVKFRGQIVATRRNKAILNHAEEYYEDVDMEEATLPDGGGHSDSDATAASPAESPADSTNHSTAQN